MGPLLIGVAFCWASLWRGLEAYAVERDWETNVGRGGAAAGGTLVADRPGGGRHTHAFEETGHIDSRKIEWSSLRLGLWDGGCAMCAPCVHGPRVSTDSPEKGLLINLGSPPQRAKSKYIFLWAAQLADWLFDSATTPNV